MSRRRRSRSEEEQLLNPPDLQLHLSLPRMEEHSEHKMTSSFYSYSSSSSSELELGARSSDHIGSTEGSAGAAAAMVLAGCPRCLMYILLPAGDPQCPKCKSRNLVDVQGGDRR